MMYPKFIEVHYENGLTANLNIDNIEGFRTDSDVGCAVFMTSMACLKLKETYDEVKQMITESGCLIRKHDPRLDLTHPLSLEDLKDMIGEPVWCTNVDSWMLVKSADDLSVRVVWVSGNTSEYSEDDLRKFPMYRMKR